MTTPIAFFDFDGTLTRRDSFLPWLHQLLGTPELCLRLLQASPVLLGYLAGWVANDRAKETLLRACVAGRHVDELQQVAHHYAHHQLSALLRPEGMARLEWHRERGHECVLVSASLDLYLEPWASEQGFAGLLCSRLEVDAEGRVSGNLAGDNCHGEVKVKLIREWLNDRVTGTLYAYGDTRGDLPMLHMADQGYFWKGGNFIPVSALP